MIETRFTTTPLATPRVSVRGKTSGALRDAGTFQWTAGVRALCVLFLKGALSKAGGGGDTLLIGGYGTLAASLDYATSKQPSWLIEMFGADSLGRCEFIRLVNRTNTERKRPGPTVIALKAGVVEEAAIEVFLNGRPVSSASALGDILAGLIEGGNLTKQTGAGSGELRKMVA